MTVDYAALELRVLALMSEPDADRAAATFLKRLTGLDYDQLTPTGRLAARQLAFGPLYEMRER